MSRRVRMTGGTAPELVYWMAAAVSGVIVGLNVIPYPIDILFLLGLGFGSTLLRRMMLGSESRRESFVWLLVFAAVWLPLVWLRHGFPFR